MAKLVIKLAECTAAGGLYKECEGQQDHQEQHSVNRVRRRPSGGGVERGEERKPLLLGKDG
jgi:hypothetical protein